MLQGLFGAVIVASVMLHGVPTRASSSTAATVLAPSERVRNSVETKAVVSSTLPSVLAHFTVAVLLLFLSQPLGRLLARGID
jgi:F0F1-type ATP synthase membrane subunit c/vacuolar-type H+-ATPase subunit K